MSQLLPDATIYRITTAAAACWLVYDSLLVLDDEIRLIWRSPNSLPKTLYLTCRYLGLAFSITFAVVSIPPSSKPTSVVFWFFVSNRSELKRPNSCVASTVMSIAPALITVAADALLLLRVCALYRDQKFLCRILLVYYALEKLAEIGLSCMGIYYGVLAETLYDMPCPSTESGTSPISLGSALPAIAFNVALFGLTIAKVVPYWRMRRFGMSPFLEAFVGDGALYFFMICCMLSVDVFLPVLLNSTISPSLYAQPWIIAAYPIAACRLLLELRCSVNRPTMETNVRATDVRIPTFGVSSSELSSGPLTAPTTETRDYSTLEMYTLDA